VPAPSTNKSPLLPNLGRSFQSLTVKLIFGLLCLVFALQFGGPQAKGCTETQTAYAAKVWGSTISEGDFRAAYLLAGGDRFQPEMAEKIKLKSLVLNGLVERSLLARQARKLGFQINDEQVLQSLAEDGNVYVSMSIDAPIFLRSGPQKIEFTDKDGNFSKDNLRKFVMYQLHRSINEFADNQTEEILAQRMRDLITSAVLVSDEDVWDDYRRENEKVTLKYLRFSPVYYRDRLQPNDQQLQSWTASHQAEVEAAYQRDRHNYTGLEKQVRARTISIKIPSDATADQKEEARKRATDLLKRARKGDAFTELALRFSEDLATAKKGGDLGYNPRGRMPGSFDNAQFSLKPGEISDLVETDSGFNIIKVEAIREGDVPMAEAKSEIARNLWLDGESARQAKRDAEKALARLKQGAEFETLEAEFASDAMSTGPSASGAAAKTGEADPLAPQVRETAPFSRIDMPIHGPFDSRPLTEKAFELTPEKPLPGEPTQLGEDWFVYSLKEHTTAKQDDFSPEVQDRFRTRLLTVKRHDVLGNYIRNLYKEARASNAVHFNQSVSLETSSE
jgi:peptidyl-prolyl cis-trans isomerase D